MACGSHSSGQRRPLGGSGTRFPGRVPLWKCWLDTMVSNCLQQGLAHLPKGEEVWPAGYSCQWCLTGTCSLVYRLCMAAFELNSGIESLSWRPNDLQNLKITALYRNRFLTPGLPFQIWTRRIGFPRASPFWTLCLLRPACSEQQDAECAPVPPPACTATGHLCAAAQAGGPAVHSAACPLFSLSALSSLPSRPFPLWHIWKLQLIIVD